jgi:hypothetical protein
LVVVDVEAVVVVAEEEAVDLVVVVAEIEVDVVVAVAEVTLFYKYSGENK